MATAPKTLADIQAQIAELQKQADALRQKEFASALAEVKEKIAAFGFTAKDLGFSKAGAPAGKRGSAKGSVAAKYKSKDGSQTWSGRGRQPKWVAAHVEGGGKVEDLLI